jgi:hypothetical protein
MLRTTSLAVIFGMLLAGPVRAESKTYELTIAAGDTDRSNTPIAVVLPLPLPLAKAESVVVEDGAGKKLAAQLTAPGLLAKTPVTDNVAAKELHFILPALKAGQTATFKATVSTDPPAKVEGFVWKEKPGEFGELSFGSRPVLRYECAKLDESTKEARDKTYKVFHHLYDPEGKQLMTQGTGGKLYPHHRGIYYGFNKVTYGSGKTADVWHCTKGSHQSHEKFLASEAGPVLGRHRVEIAWHGDDKGVFAVEERELTVYNVPGGQLVEFASRLRSAGDKVKLDGDPQHAGFQFRANGEVVDNAKQTYYLRPDGQDKPGATRNWDAKNPDVHANLPWNVMSFVVGGQRYTVCYLDRPANPKPARFSERDYGRFGSYFVHELDGKNTLDIDYRLWLQKGEMKGPDVASLDADLAKPPVVTVK